MTGEYDAINYKNLVNIYGKQTLNSSTVKRWVKRVNFNSGTAILSESHVSALWKPRGRRIQSSSDICDKFLQQGYESPDSSLKTKKNKK